MNKSVNQYLSDVKNLFPIFDKKEKEYFNQFKETLLKEGDELSYEECVERYGSPKDVMLSYFEELDSDTVVKQLNRKQFIKKYSRIAIACIIIVSLVACLCIFKAYQDSKSSHGSYFDDEITIIK